MTNQFLTDPDNAKAYQTLCDHPRGSVRVWATEAGWKRSRMERFILRLKALQLARVDSGPMGSIFVPLGVPDTVPDTVPAYLGTKSNCNSKLPVSRYGEAPGNKNQPIAELDELRLVSAANEVLKQRNWTQISLDNFGSLKAAKKMLAVVPCDRAIPLLEQAVRLFNPSATDGEPLRSLGHPFITRYVINEFRRTERDLAQGQLSMFFVERTSPPQQVYGTGRVGSVDSCAPGAPVERTRSNVLTPNSAVPLPDPVIAPPATVDAVAQEWRAIAAADERPARR